MGQLDEIGGNLAIFDQNAPRRGLWGCARRATERLLPHRCEITGRLRSRSGERSRIDREWRGRTKALSRWHRRSRAPSERAALHLPLRGPKPEELAALQAQPRFALARPDRGHRLHRALAAQPHPQRAGERSSPVAHQPVRGLSAHAEPAERPSLRAHGQPDDGAVRRAGFLQPGPRQGDADADAHFRLPRARAERGGSPFAATGADPSG